MSAPSLSPDARRLLEAVLDERLGVTAADGDPAVRAELEASGLLGPESRAAARDLVRAAARGRGLEWVTRTTTQGDVLDAFAAHCREALDDVEVVEHDGVALVARWRTETSRIELRSGVLGLERLAGEQPTMVLTDLERDGPRLVERYLDDPVLRSSVAILDLVRLERLGAVRSSVFVHLDWHLREAYGVKVLPANAFTQGLLVRGIISLGMG